VRIERLESHIFDVRKTPLYMVSLVRGLRCKAIGKFPVALASECAAYSPQYQTRDYLRKVYGDVRIERIESPTFDACNSPLYMVSLIQGFSC
jgi:hypothetical protein